MKIIGIGTDLVAIARIRTIWEHYGQAFARRILTKEELEDLQTSRQMVPFLAKRYAAKEAVAKALGTGFRPGGSRLTEIGVRNNSLGCPYLLFSGETEKLIKEKGVLEGKISLSDEKEFALAFVVLVGE